jgi:hypothetical protein
MTSLSTSAALRKAADTAWECGAVHESARQVEVAIAMKQMSMILRQAADDTDETQDWLPSTVRG